MRCHSRAPRLEPVGLALREGHQVLGEGAGALVGPFAGRESASWFRHWHAMRATRSRILADCVGGRPRIGTVAPKRAFFPRESSGPETTVTAPPLGPTSASGKQKSASGSLPASAVTARPTGRDKRHLSPAAPRVHSLRAATTLSERKHTVPSEPERSDRADGGIQSVRRDATASRSHQDFGPRKGERFARGRV